MHGPQILVRSLSRPATPQKGTGHLWQYHSRSDRHSKIACWGVLFDLLGESADLRRHFEAGALAFGVNHEMSDFRVNRRKNLDLVVCTPRETSTGRTLTDLVASTASSSRRRRSPRSPSCPPYGRRRWAPCASRSRPRPA